MANLGGGSPFTSVATATGTGPDGNEVDDTDDAVVFPPVLATTITRPTPTLPVTGADYETLRGTSMAGFAFVVAGTAVLAAAAFIGRLQVRQIGAAAAGQHEMWLTIEIKPTSRTIYVPLRSARSDTGLPIN